MVTIEMFREMALSLTDATEQPHFDLTSFRIKNKIFATLDISKQLACIMLSPIDQSTFIVFDKAAIYPVQNKWGQQGATYFDLKKARKVMLKDALTLAYNQKSAGKPTAVKIIKKK